MSCGCTSYGCGQSEATPNISHSIAIAGGITLVGLILAWIASGEAFGADPGYDIVVRRS